jgi:hypothetical protein
MTGFVVDADTPGITLGKKEINMGESAEGALCSRVRDAGGLMLDTTTTTTTTTTPSYPRRPTCVRYEDGQFSGRGRAARERGRECRRGVQE